MNWYTFRNVLLVLIVCLSSLGSVSLRKQSTTLPKVLASKPAQKSSAPVITMASGFQVVEFKQVDRKVSMVLLNSYTKNITAYILTATSPDIASAILTHSMDLIDMSPEDGGVIHTGAKTVFEGEIYGPAEQCNLTIRAVVFEDFTADGEERYVKEILDNRQGRQALINTVLPKIRLLAHITEQPVSLAHSSFSSQLTEAKEFVASIANNQRPKGFSDMMTGGYWKEADAIRLRLEEVDKDVQSGDTNRIKFRTLRLESLLEKLRDRLYP
ncbi:MAG: hypothetical protein HY011_24010 [Acidobacteria bacterium]|nr:hypothetical protein [Acidobacteriota bacterium]